MKAHPFAAISSETHVARSADLLHAFPSRRAPASRRPCRASQLGEPGRGTRSGNHPHRTMTAAASSGPMAARRHASVGPWMPRGAGAPNISEQTETTHERPRDLPGRAAVPRRHRTHERGVEPGVADPAAGARRARRTSSSSCSTTSGSASCRASAGLVDTPVLDRFAANGLRYTNMHTTALCSPSRGAIVTGRNHHSLGLGHDLRDVHRVPRLQRHPALRQGHVERDAAAPRLQHVPRRQVAPVAARARDAGRALRPLAARTRVRAVLRLPGRRHQPVVSGARVRQPLRSSSPRSRRTATT